jgi:hypothetical protein
MCVLYFVARLLALPYLGWPEKLDKAKHFSLLWPTVSGTEKTLYNIGT